jgi:acyl-CoA synthetase (AMP-forming)/AMP-acid ligase II
LENHADWRPDETALRFADTNEALTFGEFDEQANRFANALHDRGVRSGDRVGLFLFNTREFPIALYGCHKLNAIPVAANTQLAADDLQYIINDMGAQLLIYDHEIDEKLEEAAAGAIGDYTMIGAGFDPDRGRSFEAVLESGSPQRPPSFEKTPDEPSYMFYTSGTTGDPKGVIHSVKSGRERANSSIIECGISTDSVSLALLPWYHGAGIDITVRATVSVGAEIIVLKRPDVARSLEVIEEQQVTHVTSVPSLTQRFAESDSIESRDLSSVESFVHTGEVLTEKQAKLFREKLTENIYNLYGSSEIGVSTALRPDDLPEHAGTVGRPCKGVEARVVEPGNGTETNPDDEVPVGTEGELILRTDQLFPGYFENHRATREVVRDGWYYTNDMAVIDGDGYITVTGRVDDMIISGGELISPAEVEDAIETHEEISSAVVVGHSDEEWGERVVAYVATDTDLSEAELDSYLKENGKLADYKRPKEYNFVEEIPRTGAGKKQRTPFKEGE